MNSTLNWILTALGFFVANSVFAKAAVKLDAETSQVYVPYDETTDTGGYWTDVQTGVETTAPDGSQQQANLRAFMKLIRVVESGDDYGAIVGGGRTTDFREHPWVLNPDLPLIMNSNASGAYQFIAATPRYPSVPTWQRARDQAGVRDFSPASQDAAAVVILKWRNAYEDIIYGNFYTAMAKLVDEWQAFDKILKYQYVYSLDDAASIYEQAGGQYA